MDTGPGQDAVFRFAGFALDPARAVPHGAAVELRPKSYAVLLHLVRNPGRLVAREALLDAVWPDVTVGDEALTQCVRDVRRALGEAGPALLRTLPRRGYMLDAAVEVGPPDARGLPSPVPGPVAEAPGPHDPAPPAAGGGPVAIARAPAAARPEASAAARPEGASPPSAEACGRPPSAWRPWAAGLVLALLLAGGAAWVRAPSGGDPPAPTAAVPPAPPESTPREVAARLTREGNRLMSVEGGRAAWLRQRELFAKAVEADPAFAPAWIALVFTYTNMLANGFSVNRAGDLRAAEAASERGMALAPENPEAHAALCAVLRLHPGRLEEALAACRRAVELTPTPRWARANVGWVLILLGRVEEAEGPIRASIASAPPEHSMQTIWHYYLGTGQLLLGRDEAAAAVFRRALHAWRMDDRATLLGLIAALALAGQRAEAEHLMVEARQRWPNLSLAGVRANAPSARPVFLAQRERLLTGLALARLP